MGAYCHVYTQHNDLWEGNRFLLTGFPISGSWEPSCSELAESISFAKHKNPTTPREVVRSWEWSSNDHSRSLLERAYVSPASGSLSGSRVAITSHQLSLSQGLGCTSRSLQTVMQRKLHLRGTSQPIPPCAALGAREWEKPRTHVPGCPGS